MGQVVSVPVNTLTYVVDWWYPVNVPPPISSTKILEGTAGPELGACLEERGYCLIHPEPELIEAMLKAKEDAAVFFNSSEEGKRAFMPLPSADPLLMGKRENRGYIVEQDSEYLKIRMLDDTTKYPKVPPSLEASFRAAMDPLHKITWNVFQSVSKLEIGTTGKTWMDKQAAEVFGRFVPEGSSFSVIKYWGSNGKEEDEHELVGEHVDTGLMTVIRIAEEPGLRIYDQLHERWIEVEKLGQENDLVLFLGTKIQLLVDETIPLTPTLHKVVLPRNKERHAVLFFMDVPAG